jgi:hypothetical protein
MTVNHATPDWHYEQAKLLLDDIVAHKNDESFTEVAATLLTQASIAHSLQGLLAAKILDP